jgi:hypothetical protein
VKIAILVHFLFQKTNSFLMEAETFTGENDAHTEETMTAEETTGSESGFTSEEVQLRKKAYRGYGNLNEPDLYPYRGYK